MSWGSRSRGRSNYGGGYGGFAPYVPVAQRRADANKAMSALSKKGLTIEPVVIEGRTIAKSFWGKTWCDHVESFGDYENRLPRGRTYVRNGSVCHLAIEKGEVKAKVSGSSMYDISINIKTLDSARWESLKKSCAGKIGSLIELLQGKFSNEVMAMVIDGKQGLLPSNKEISYKCSCPDWASMCKHVAAVIYGIGARLDHQPELLFLLRGVDHSELIQTEVVSAVLAGGSDRRSRRQAPVDVQALFEVEIEGSSETQGVEPQGQKKAKTATTKTKAATAKAKTATTKTKADKPSAKVEKAQKPAKAESKASSAAKVKPLAKAESKSKASSAPKAAPALAQPFHATPRTIASLRQQLGLSASAMARALGVTPVTVSRWENSPTALKLNAKNLAQLQTLRDGGTPSL